MYRVRLYYRGEEKGTATSTDVPASAEIHAFPIMHLPSHLPYPIPNHQTKPPKRYPEPSTSALPTRHLNTYCDCFD